MRFLLCTGDFLLFLVFVSPDPNSHSGQMLNHATYDVYLLKSVTEKCYGIMLFSLLYVHCKIYFLFVLSKRWNIKYAKQFITPAMEFADIAAFTSAT